MTTSSSAFAESEPSGGGREELPENGLAATVDAAKLGIRIETFIRGTHHGLVLSRNKFIDARPVICFDGLDEVPELYRPIALRHLNHLSSSLGLSLAVTCRTDDYKRLLDKGLSLNKSLAVDILPLSSHQIESCLEDGGQSIVNAFDSNPEVRDLASTPLGLSILYMAYFGATGKLDIASINGKLMVRHVVVENFINRMQQRAERRIKNRVCDNHPKNDIPTSEFLLQPCKAKSLMTWLAIHGSEEFQISSLAKHRECQFAPKQYQ